MCDCLALAGMELGGRRGLTVAPAAGREPRQYALTGDEPPSWSATRRTRMSGSSGATPATGSGTGRPGAYVADVIEGRAAAALPFALR